MSAPDLPRAIAHPDGSLDLWTRGRRVHFPADNGRPVVHEKQAPPPTAVDPPSALTLEITHDVTIIRGRGWLVINGADDATVTPSRPKPGNGHVFYRYRDR